MLHAGLPGYPRVPQPLEHFRLPLEKIQLLPVLYVAQLEHFHGNLLFLLSLSRFSPGTEADKDNTWQISCTPLTRTRLMHLVGVP